MLCKSIPCHVGSTLVHIAWFEPWFTLVLADKAMPPPHITLSTTTHDLGLK